MIKKLVLASTLLLASSTIFSAPTVNSSAAAATTTAASMQTTAAATPSNPTTPAVAEAAMPHINSSFYAGLGISVINDRGYTGLTPKVSAGYGTLLGNSQTFYGAAEIFAGAGSLLLSQDNQFHRVSGLLGASIIPGYKMDDWTLLFARLGVESAFYSHMNSTRTGGLFGLGFQTYAFQHWDFRGEYDYGTNENLNQFSLDFIYKFC